MELVTLINNQKNGTKPNSRAEDATLSVRNGAKIFCLKDVSLYLPMYFLTPLYAFEKRIHKAK